MIRPKRLESPSLTRRVSSRYVCPIFVVVDLVCPDTWPESPFREVCALPIFHLCFTAFTAQCQGPGCGTHPPARAFTHSMCLASSHVISPKFLSSSFLLQPHDTVFTGCLLRDGCGTNPHPPGPSPTLSGFFQMPSSPNFTPRVLFFNSMTPPSLDVILRPVRLIHAERAVTYSFWLLHMPSSPPLLPSPSAQWFTVWHTNVIQTDIPFSFFKEQKRTICLPGKLLIFITCFAYHELPFEVCITHNVDCETSVLTDKVIHQVSTGRGSGGGVAKRRKYICISPSFQTFSLSGCQILTMILRFRAPDKPR